MKFSPVSSLLKASLFSLLAAPALLGAAEIQLLKHGDWTDTTLWTGGVVPASPGAAAAHSVVISNLATPSGTVLVNGGAGQYNLLGLSYDESVGVMFRNSTDVTNNNVVLNITGDLVKKGSGTLQFRNNTNGSIALNVEGDLTIKEGIVYVGVAAAGAANFTVQGNTTVESGLLSMRLGRRGTEAVPTLFGNVSIGATGAIELSSGGNSSATAEYFRFDGLNGAGTVSVTNATATAYTGELIVRSTGNDLYSGAINQAGTATLRFNKEGSGSLTLSGSSTFGGGTKVTEGRLIAAHANALGTGAVAVGTAATLEIGEGTAITNAVTIDGGTVLVNGQLNTPSEAVAFTGRGGAIGGNGEISVGLRLTSTQQTLTPGEGVGTLTFSADQAWEAFSYDWELADWSNLPGDAGVSYDQIAISQTLDLSLATEVRFTISSLNGIALSELDGFDGEDMHSWTILEADGGIIGFDADLWQIGTASGFADVPALWSLAQEGNAIVLRYQSIPEPGTVSLLLVAFAGGTFIRRRSARVLL